MHIVEKYAAVIVMKHLKLKVKRKKPKKDTLPATDDEEICLRGHEVRPEANERAQEGIRKSISKDPISRKHQKKTLEENGQGEKRLAEEEEEQRCKHVEEEDEQKLSKQKKEEFTERASHMMRRLMKYMLEIDLIRADQDGYVNRNRY